jgi:hypothetical protein
LVSFVRIGAFQWVTGNPNRKILSRLNSRPGLWTERQNRFSPLLPPAPADHYGRAPHLPSIIALISV